jgi:DNA-binding winged helix-turn-helix (wHTH) protein
MLEPNSVVTKKIFQDLYDGVIKPILEGEKVVRVVSLPLQGRSTILRHVLGSISLSGWKTVAVDLPSIEKLPEENELFADNKNIIVLINSIDTIQKNLERFKHILGWYYRHQEKVALIFGQGVEDIDNVKQELREFWPILLKNTYWMGLFDNDYMEFFAETNVKLELDNQLYQKYSGGYLPFMKRWVDSRFSLGESTSEWLTDKVIEFNLENLWECLSISSQLQLLDLARGKPREFGVYMTKTGIVKLVDGKWKLFSPLFEEWLQNKLGQGSSKIEEKEGKLWLNGNIDLEMDLSFQEYQVLGELFKNSSQTVTRNQIAEILWPKDTEEKYSDWAIDQIMSKIRKKIGDVGEKRMIKTIKGQGFVFSQE